MRMRSRLHGLVVASIMVGTLVLVSCSTTSSTPSAATPSTTTSAKPYGSLTIAADLGAGQIDPQLGTATSFYFTSVAVFDTLTYYASNNELRPGIAERWEISRDGLSHTVYIRKGVKFHDGSDLTGADVKFTIERMLAPETVAPDAVNWRSLVTSVELKDDYTVVLHLKQPQFELMKGYDAGMTAIVPKKYIQDKGVDYFRRQPVGSGPWKVVTLVPGDRLELEAVESHWRAVPKFKNITLRHIKEEGAKVAMLKTGEVDMAQIAPDSAPALKSAGLRIMSDFGAGQYLGHMYSDIDHPEKHAFGDVRARKAMQLGLNSKEIADKILGGYGAPFALLGVDETAYFWDSNALKVDPYDPEQAKKLLVEAGYPSGFKTWLNDIGGGGIISTIDLALSGYWRKIGVDAEVRPIDYGAFWPKISPKLLPDVWGSVYVNMASPPRHFEMMMIAYHSTKGFVKYVRDPRLDELIDKVPTIADPVEKKRLALEAAVLAKNDYSILRVVSQKMVLAVSTKVGDVPPFKLAYISGLMLETITHAK